jgi:hypothetical protein
MVQQHRLARAQEFLVLTLPPERVLMVADLPGLVTATAMLQAALDNPDLQASGADQSRLSPATRFRRGTSPTVCMASGQRGYHRAPSSPIINRKWHDNR